jgi:hypothetical protein
MLREAVSVAVLVVSGHLVSGCNALAALGQSGADEGSCAEDECGYADEPEPDGPATPVPRTPCPNGGDGMCGPDYAWRCEGEFLAEHQSGCTPEAPCRLVPTENGHVQAVCSIGTEPCQSVSGDGAECQGNTAVVCLQGYPVSTMECISRDRCIVVDPAKTDGARCTLDAECPAEVGGTACHDGLVYNCHEGISMIVRSCTMLAHHCAEANGQGVCAVSPDGPRSFAFRPIAGGVFQTARTNTTAEISDFEMLETEVTLGQYAECQAAGRCTAPYEPCRYDDRGLASSVHADLPIRCVSFDQAMEYCAFVDGRLPTELQWEYALRNGGQNVGYPWGDATPSCEQAILRENDSEGCGRREPWPGCSRSDDITDQGVCDLAGNVSEWVMPVVSNIGPQGSRGADFSGMVRESLTSQAVGIPQGMRHLGFRCVRVTGSF